MREPLLCDECEQQFCDSERYASEFSRGTLEAWMILIRQPN
jgi:hypothetical protein